MITKLLQFMYLLMICLKKLNIMNQKTELVLIVKLLQPVLVSAIMANSK
jgi:hypothetical protein